MKPMWHIPPRNQGQIVEVSYAAYAKGNVCRVYKKRFDQSDRSVTYFASRPLRDDEGDYWNDAPKNKRWRSITKDQLPEELQ